MRALQADAAGAISNLKVVPNVPTPKPAAGSGDVVVKVECAALNPVDWKMIVYDMLVQVTTPSARHAVFLPCSVNQCDPVTSP